MRYVFTLALPLLFACSGAPFVERSTQVVFDPDDREFWSLPMPSDLRREADGTYDLDKWPASRESDLLQDWMKVANRRMRDGWGVSSAVFVPLSGPIDESTLPASPAAAMEKDASVFLLDIDPASPERGRRFPVEVKILEQVDIYTPENLLAATPVFGFVRRTSTNYALIVTTAVLDASGAPIGRSEKLHELLEDDDHFEPLRAALEHEGIPREDVAGVAMFRTFDHNATMRELVDWRRANFPAELKTAWTVEQEYDSYQVLRATFDVPVIQTGVRPYRDQGEGLIKRDANGAPELVETQEVRLILALPKAPQPRDGWPLLMYMHGSGGEAEQFLNRGSLDENVPRSEQPAPRRGSGPAEYLAQRGVASLGMDFGLHGERHSPPDTTGLVFYNLFGNIDATLDNFTIAIMELEMISEIVDGVTIDPAVASTLDAGDAPDGLIRFDPERLTAMGQSMGTTLGVPWAGIDPRLDGIIFSGAGGILVEIAVTAVEPVALKGLVELSFGLRDGPEIHLSHPALHAAQNLWDFVDPIAKAPHVVLDPAPGSKPKHVMMTAGVRDGYFHPRSQAAMAVALGVPLAGDEVEPILPGALELAGRAPVSLPVSGNMDVTAAVLQYEAPNTNGHYVVFNQAGARHQYTCFAASVGADGATIPAAADDETPCP
ncbi:MAG: hypothetical protein RIT81_23470 [Deltaproteobacteria bacterium]